MLGNAKYITLEAAQMMAAAGEAEARKNNWNVAIAILDGGANLILFQKMDDTQLGSAKVAIDKARSAALFKRPTKVFQDTLAAGGEGLRLLKIQGAVPVEGGIPLVIEGKIVGAIGVSGGSSAQDGQAIGAVGVSGVLSAQDEQVAQAAINALG